ncbi:MAG: adenylate/guanylate cyclase domain-containing protein [Anaerolineales bacterium]|nr:adenylate/guanylate cyclase domain-containing protein [Anaerolineales bacterium]
MAKEFTFNWQWDVKSPPEAIWSLAADTNRFNRDTGQPEIELLSNVKGTKLARMKIPIFRVEWEEEPFEWTYPYSFGIVRRYRRGPIDEIRVNAQFAPLPDGGTRISYQSIFVTGNLLAQLGIPFAIGVIAKRRFERAFRKYDEILQRGDSPTEMPRQRRLSAGGRSRFKSQSEAVVRQGTNPELMNRLEEFLDHADELSIQRIRPYALADHWKTNRRAVLEMFLRATRAGIVDMSWDLLCPSCRGITEGHSNLADVRGDSHCNTCQIDFRANFDHNIEVVFRPNASVRAVDFAAAFCVGSPQLQPHVVMSQSLSPLRSLPVDVQLEPGRYNMRVLTVNGSAAVTADGSGAPKADLRVTQFGWPPEEHRVSLHPTFNLINATDADSTFQLERASWGDQAATAADVTALQVFRDLFATEVIRPGEEISVGSITLMFTDLRESTRLYRRIGDAPAFGRVREHFQVLEDAIEEEGGAIVKTMGDSVMAAFRHPIAALRAMWKAQVKIMERGEPMLWLKAGMHKGPCIVVNLNERLDYFGSTVNITARLPGFSQGGELIFTEEIYNDPDVQEFLTQNLKPDALSRFTGDVKGFDEPFTMWRLRV